MIPRARVNYGLFDLVVSLSIRSAGQKYLNRLTAKLSSLFPSHVAIPMPSGRAGLYYILRTLPQTKVIVPAYTCNAVSEAILLAGKKIVYADVKNNQFNSDLDDCKHLLDSDSILIATHQYGIPCDIKSFVSACKDSKTVIIEDVAAALGTRVAGSLVGSFGDYAFFSFDSTKLINVPLKSGFILVRDPAQANRIREAYERESIVMPLLEKVRLLILGGLYAALSNRLLYRLFHLVYFRLSGKHTAETRQLCTKLNNFYLYRMSDWQASMALKQLGQLERLVQKRRYLYEAYQEKFRSLLNREGEQPSSLQSLVLPPIDKDKEWSCIRFPILCENKMRVYRQATRSGVDLAFSFTYLCSDNLYPNAHAIANRVLNVPFYYGMRMKELSQVARILVRAIQEEPDRIRKKPKMQVRNLPSMIRNRWRREEIYSTAEYWDSKAEEFHDEAVSMWPNNYLNHLYEQEQKDLLLTIISDWRNMVVLDIGCGTGRISRFLASHGANVHGFDFSAKAIELAKNWSSLGTDPSPEYSVQSLFDLDYHQKFDIAVSWGSVAIACKNIGELRVAMDKIYDAIKPSGQILLLEPIHIGPLHRVLNASLGQFTDVMRQSGFEIASSGDLHFWPARIALAYFPLPKKLTTTCYGIGQYLSKSLGPGWGDYKFIHAHKK